MRHCASTGGCAAFEPGSGRAPSVAAPDFVLQESALTVPRPGFAPVAWCAGLAGAQRPAGESPPVLQHRLPERPPIATASIRSSTSRPSRQGMRVTRWRWRLPKEPPVLTYYRAAWSWV